MSSSPSEKHSSYLGIIVFEAIYLWLIIAVILAGADILLGTFYLLVFGFSAIAAFAAAVVGLSFIGQLAVFALFGILGCIYLSFHRKKNRSRNTLDAEKIQNLNEGQLVTVRDWREDGTTDVFFRGTHWNAEPVSGEARRPGLWKISGMNGNTLILKFEKEK